MKTNDIEMISELPIEEKHAVLEEAKQEILALIKDRRFIAANRKLADLFSCLFGNGGEYEAFYDAGILWCIDMSHVIDEIWDPDEESQNEDFEDEHDYIVRSQDEPMDDYGFEPEEMIPEKQHRVPRLCKTLISMSGVMFAIQLLLCLVCRFVVSPTITKTLNVVANVLVEHPIPFVHSSGCPDVLGHAAFYTVALGLLGMALMTMILNGCIHFARALIRIFRARYRAWKVDKILRDF